jgi:hypothetical protein
VVGERTERSGRVGTVAEPNGNRGGCRNGRRCRAVFFHDVNHLLTGYDTTFGGEVEIAAFEVASGCGRFWIVWYINLSMFAIGLALNPRAVFRAFRRGKRASSIYRSGDDRDRLAAMSVPALRASLGIDDPPPRTLATDWARFGAWAIVAVVVLLAPFAAAVTVVTGLIHALPTGAR